MIIKCKICGGDVRYNPGENCGWCERCGRVSTVPRGEDGQRPERFNRGNDLRRQGEYNRAAGVYEQILEEDNTDAEAHWCAALSRYGVEYYEDPAAEKWFPVCSAVRLEFTADADYQAALKYAPDTLCRDLYEEQAQEIEEIQKEILAFAAKEKPYDVFVCCRETEADGERCRDSELAEEVSRCLAEQGYRVFFPGNIPGEKPDQEYETYVFAVLNSAGAMAVIGTESGNFSEVRVRNEWSRFLHLMKEDPKRLLIPCYRDMDPSDLPEEIRMLQSEDMSRIGFIQDLLRDIGKLPDAGQKKERMESVGHGIKSGTSAVLSPGVQSLKERTASFTEDAEPDNDGESRNQVPESDGSETAAGEELRQAEDPARKARKRSFLAIAAIMAVMAACYFTVSVIYPGVRYSKARALQEAGKYEEAIAVYEALRGYGDSAEQIEVCRNEKNYQAAKALQEAGKYEEAVAAYEALHGYRDSVKQIEVCRNEKNYQAANALREAGKYEEAIAAYEALNGYRDSAEQILETKYRQADSLYSSGKYAEAYAVYATITGYKDVDRIIANDRNIAAAAAAAREAKFAVGKHVTFGMYPQTKAGHDSTPIEWLVLARDGQKALLLSRYGLDVKPYNNKYTDVTWETCTLRSWLNGDFINKAFTAGEQAGIVETELDNSWRQGYSWNTSGGKNTPDRIFLLSYAEAKKYFGIALDGVNNIKPRVSPTAYALQRRAYTDSSYKTEEGAAAGCWWLRSPGSDQKNAALVFMDGRLNIVNYVNLSSACVRPALWIDLESGIF